MVIFLGDKCDDRRVKAQPQRGVAGARSEAEIADQHRVVVYRMKPRPRFSLGHRLPLFVMTDKAVASLCKQVVPEGNLLAESG